MNEEGEETEDEPMWLVSVNAPHFCAGLILHGDICVQAPPILRWAVGMNRPALRAYFAKKEWIATIRRLHPE